MSTFTLQGIVEGLDTLKDLIATPSGDGWDNLKALIIVFFFVFSLPLIIVLKGRSKEVVAGILLGVGLGSQIGALFFISGIYSPFFGVPPIVTTIVFSIVLATLVGLVVKFLYKTHPHFVIVFCTSLLGFTGYGMYQYYTFLIST